VFAQEIGIEIGPGETGFGTAAFAQALFHFGNRSLFVILVAVVLVVVTIGCGYCCYCVCVVDENLLEVRANARPSCTRIWKQKIPRLVPDERGLEPPPRVPCCASVQMYTYCYCYPYP
jgi:hypothetical protein